MSRPEEPTEALPTRAVPAQPDPGATVDLDRTLVPGAAEPTVHLAGADPTVHLGGPASTAHLTDATVHLPGAPPAAGGTGTGPTIGGTAAGRPAMTDPDPTGAYRGIPTAGARPSTGGSTAGGEIRFGPGVPATPPTAPAWPAVPTARRPRPLWRRLVSVLSTLLTVALLAAVGLYLWQRLSPLEVEGVSVAVSRPAGDRCDVTVDVVATVRTNGRGGVIRYQWFRSDGAPGSLLTERVGRGQRTVTLTLKWSFSGVGATRETATLNIVEPSPVQSGTEVAYRCRRG